jgi:hypothetical protein
MRAANLLSSLAAVVTMAVPLNAQPALPDGEWTGNITPPEGAAIGVRYLVSNDSVDRRLVIIIAEERFVAGDLRVEDGLLYFNWNPGPEVECHLELREANDDSVYEGTCGDEETGIGRIRMVSPQQTSTAQGGCPAGELRTRVTRASF